MFANYLQKKTEQKILNQSRRRNFGKEKNWNNILN